MRGHRKRHEPPQFLSGWKDIANYLGKGVRTVQRYEWQFGLPVRRPADRSRGAVLATKAELDAWVGASAIGRAFYLTKSPVTASYEGAADSIKNALAEMCRLRDQMTALRSEVRESVAGLRDSIQGLRGGLKQDAYREIWPTLALWGLKPEDGRRFELLSGDSSHRKGS